MADAQTAAAENSVDVVARLKRRMIDHALPLWSGEGWDRTTGGFIDRLDPDGRADAAAPRRILVQARQIYCFAKAAQMGWYPRRPRDRAEGAGLSFDQSQKPRRQARLCPCPDA